LFPGGLARPPLFPNTMSHAPTHMFGLGVLADANDAFDRAQAASLNAAKSASNSRDSVSKVRSASETAQIASMNATENLKLKATQVLTNARIKMLDVMAEITTTTAIKAKDLSKQAESVLELAEKNAAATKRHARSLLTRRKQVQDAAKAHAQAASAAHVTKASRALKEAMESAPGVTPLGRSLTPLVPVLTEHLCPPCTPHHTSPQQPWASAHSRGHHAFLPDPPGGPTLTARTTAANHRREKDAPSRTFGRRPRSLSCAFASYFARDPLPPHDTERGRGASVSVVEAGDLVPCLGQRPRACLCRRLCSRPFALTHTHAHILFLLAFALDASEAWLQTSHAAIAFHPNWRCMHISSALEIRGALLRLACTYPLQGIIVHISSTD